LKKVNTKSRHPYLEYNLTLWGCSALLCFSVALVKLPQYGIYIVIPVILLSVRGLEELTTHFSNHRLMWSMLALLIAITVWAFVPPVRASFYAIFTGAPNPGAAALIFTLGFFALLATGWFLPSSVVLNISMRVFFWTNFILPALLIGSVFLTNGYGFLKKEKSRQEELKREAFSLPRF
ncbi:MAG TPA: hypothetical protein VEC36_00250, partial [Patescibacteria group bacterium]|nr:hypothetical protein [Patescibacteria group bacterium]